MHTLQDYATQYMIRFLRGGPFLLTWQCSMLLGIETACDLSHVNHLIDQITVYTPTGLRTEAPPASEEGDTEAFSIKLIIQ